MKRAVLVLKNGKLPENLEGDFYGADRGALVCINQKRRLKAAIGDFDSVTDEEFEQIQICSEELIRLNCRKDESDTAEALQLIYNRDYDEVIVVGGLQGRFDHTWANLQLIQRYPNVIWIDEKNRLRILQPGSHEIRKEQYQYISFFSLKSGVISLKNMEYPLDNYWMEPLDSLGLSNEIASDPGIVECTMPVLCIQCHD